MKKVLCLALLSSILSLNAIATITTSGTNCINPSSPYYTPKNFLIKSFKGDSTLNSLTVQLDQSDRITCTDAEIVYCETLITQLGKSVYMQLCPNLFRATIK